MSVVSSQEVVQFKPFTLFDGVYSVLRTRIIPPEPGNDMPYLKKLHQCWTLAVFEVFCQPWLRVM